MKPTCCLCGYAIHRNDFYVDSPKGKICSTCLVHLEESAEYSRLFKPKGPRPGQRPVRKKPQMQVAPVLLKIVS